MTAPVALKADLAAVFERYAADTDDADLRRAAAALRGQHAGRKQVDDSLPLAEVKLLVAGGLAVETAARRVAVTISGPTYSEQTARRLARKYRAAQNILSVELDSDVA
jgi:sirohydrochlorin ferrochelatase